MDSNTISERIKTRIAISKINEEDIVVKKISKFKNVGVVACILASTTGIVFATNMIINRFGPNSSDGSQVAVDNGYISTASKNSYQF